MENQTIFFNHRGVYIRDTASIVGPKESHGPIASYFDKTFQDDILGQKSYEMAEIKMHTSGLKYLMNKTKLTPDQVDAFIAGDLLDEIVGCNFTMREFPTSFLGVYNACATFGEALGIGGMMIDGGFADTVVCSTSSHFSSAERQYRYPLELGNQRTPLAQWTVTAMGATMLTPQKSPVRLECTTFGRVVDFGVTDVNNMGAAMAPAARETLLTHLKATGRTPKDYDLILTGDLGDAGSRLFRKIVSEKGVDLDENYQDCGVLIYNREAQDVGQGGSGAGCSSSVFNSYIYKNMLLGKWKRVLLMPTGALISKMSSLLGESVPGICHAVSFVRVE